MRAPLRASRCVIPGAAFSVFGSGTGTMASHYRADGVRIVHDPYAPGMAEKYGRPGATDGEGFDPYADTVGPGIYGGIVRRDAAGEVVVGRQYQGHNPRPGPVYAGGGYTPTSKAVKDPAALASLLDRFPDLVEDVSTGGARPLHVCGMSRKGQRSARVLIARGADVEALDTYGFTPLLRMASNNLAAGAQALLDGGADPNSKGAGGITPMQMAQESAAHDVIRVLQRWGGGERRPRRRGAEGTASPHYADSPASVASSSSSSTVEVSGAGGGGSAAGRRSGGGGGGVTVTGADVASVNGAYQRKDTTAGIPRGFAAMCRQMGWDAEQTWARLSERDAPYYEADNGAYIYRNALDRKWWIDRPDGAGVYTSPPTDRAAAPPSSAHWDPLTPAAGAVRVSAA